MTLAQLSVLWHKYLLNFLSSIIYCHWYSYYTRWSGPGYVQIC